MGGGGGPNNDELTNSGILRTVENPIKSASFKEIQELVKILKDRKELVPDGIINKAIKNLPRRGLAALVNLTTNNVFGL